MAEYWLISVPGEKSRPQSVYESLKEQMSGLCPVFKFPIPELKVNETLDRGVKPMMTAIWFGN